MRTSSTASARVFRPAWRATFTAAAFFLLTVWALGQTKPSSTASASPDYSQEPFIVESMVSHFAFENDGTATQELTAHLRIQTDAGVQQWGLLTFAYLKANDTVEIAYVRVRTPDGTVVITPPENFQDIESEVSRIAPMYSDLRQKHVAVKGLSPGDILEYRMQSRTHTPQVPGQFWLSYNFTSEGIALEEQLEVSVPRAREVKVKSADAQPAIREEGVRRFYIWKTNKLKRKTDEEKGKESKKDAPAPSVQLTSFRSWEEVGNWYGGLQSDRVVPTAEVRAKAAELTRTAVTEMAHY